MLRSISGLQNYSVGAVDGPIGHVKDFYFDDDKWVIRYLVVDTGAWLSSRNVLISPITIGNADWAAKLLPVSLTKRQVKDSLHIDTHKPVSHQHEKDHVGYYGHPVYRAEGVALLRSGTAVAHYRVHAIDGDIGHVHGLLIDEDCWAIRYLVVDTSNWWLGRKVLISPQWISHAHWADSTVSVDLKREAVKHAPPYAPGSQMDRDDEAGIYRHYGRPGYWADESDRALRQAR